jgi:calcium-dependent protein kinase
MYILLTSKFVFNAKDYNEILKKNKQCKVYFPKKLWENLSTEAQDLCQKMLQKYPENRISASEALEHPWL